MMRIVLTLACVITMPVLSPVRAQSAAHLVEAGVQAYEKLNLDAADSILRQALSREGVGDSVCARALIYLLAAELLRGKRDSAAAAGQRLLSLDRTYRPDTLIFSPDVQEFVASLRRDALTVTVRAGEAVTFRPKEESVTVTLAAAVPHEITAVLTRATGEPHRQLYAGTIEDSLALRWDGLDSAAGLTAPGEYALAVTSHDERGRPLRTVRLPLQITTVIEDIPPPPPAPTDSMLLDERRPAGPAVRALALGLLAGAAVMLVPHGVAPKDRWTDGRYLVGGAIALGGIAAFVAQAPGRPIPDNVARNRARWEAWRNAVEAVRARTEPGRIPPLTVRPGQLVEGGQP